MTKNPRGKYLDILIASLLGFGNLSIYIVEHIVGVRNFLMNCDIFLKV